MEPTFSPTLKHIIDVAARDFLIRAHYHLMDNPRFWYDNGLKDASRILCVTASDINVEILKGI